MTIDDTIAIFRPYYYLYENMKLWKWREYKDKMERDS
jgi:hypothetical protein